jgi:hypothetical protein
LGDGAFAGFGEEIMLMIRNQFDYLKVFYRDNEFGYMGWENIYRVSRLIGDKVIIDLERPLTNALLSLQEIVREDDA